MRVRRPPRMVADGMDAVASEDDVDAADSDSSSEDGWSGHRKAARLPPGWQASQRTYRHPSTSQRLPSRVPSSTEQPTPQQGAAKPPPTDRSRGGRGGRCNGRRAGGSPDPPADARGGAEGSCEGEDANAGGKGGQVDPTTDISCDAASWRKTMDPTWEDAKARESVIGDV